MSRASRMRSSGEFYSSIIDYVAARARGRILLAQPDAEVRHEHAVGLRDRGFAILATHDGGETLTALAAFASGDLPRPALAVIDTDMPTHSGIELIAAVRRSGWRLPIIVTSSLSEVRLRPVRARLRVAETLRKPVGSSALVRAVEDVLDADVDEGTDPVAS